MSKSTSLRIVGEFLKARGVPFSAGSWDDLYKLRLKPAVESGKVSLKELTDFVIEVEAHGRCHVFMFGCSEDKITALMDPQSIAGTAENLGLSTVLNGAPQLSQPLEPTITEISTVGGDALSSVTIKLVERRNETTLVDETTEGEFLTKVWKITPVRAVNVFRLWSNRILEVRIQSRRDGLSYQQDIARLWDTDVKRFFPTNAFSPVPLGTIKQRLWEKRKEFESLIRFSDSKVKNDYGVTVSAATGSVEADLGADAGAAMSVDAFLKNGGRWASSNVWWKTQESGVPGRDIHMLLSGEVNEFALTASCNKADYEYVLGQLTRIGEEAS